MVECNPAARSILGNMCRDFGTMILRAVRKDGSPLEYEEDPFRVVCSSGRAKTNVVMGLQKNNDMVWINASAFPMTEKGKATQNILITFTDITEQVNRSGNDEDDGPAERTTMKLKGGDQEDEPEPVKDEVQSENDLLFAMLNSIAVDSGDTREPEIQYVQLGTTKKGFAGSNAMLLGSSGNLMDDPSEQVYQGKVLVAEDNPSDQKSIAKMLDKFMVNFQMVANGSDALKAAKTGEYSLIFMSCGLPIMDGYEATNAIRSLGRGVTGKLKIVALAANEMEADEETCLRSGMDEVILKPLKMNLLQTQMKKWEDER